jgi:prepilin-type N-terminal cleavage/methylation domain-containing protein
MIKRRVTDEQGLTLIELTITIAVLGVIIVPLVASFTLALLETTSSRERTADATSAQLISTYLQNDIQSSCIHTDPADRSTPCGNESVVLNAGTCADNGTVKLELAWQEIATNNHVLVDYYVDETADGQLELHRAECVRPGPAGVVGDPEDTLLALNLEPENSADPASSIFEATCFAADGTADVDCGAPASVSVRILAKSTHVEEKASYEPFDFTFAATRRAGS